MSTTKNVPVGVPTGYAHGVPAFSNKNAWHFTGERHLVNGRFMGFKWQCVEFARRWLVHRKGLFLGQAPIAAHLFDHKTIQDIATGKDVEIVTVPNGTSVKPVPDSLLIYPVSQEAPVGHVAVIVEVGDDYVAVADQNNMFHEWDADHSTKLLLKFENGVYTITNPEDVVPPVGWMTFPFVPNRDPSTPLVWHESIEIFKGEDPLLERVTMSVKPPTEPWLDETNAAEKKFIDTFGMDLSRCRLNETKANFYKCNFEFLLNCVRATNVMHEIFLTEMVKVIQSDKLLEQFGIPKDHWGRIRRSWETQKATITGRFDFAFDQGKYLKCLEYNADSASTLLECGRIQSKYAKTLDLEGMRACGFMIEPRLIHAWEVSGVEGRVHFCIDKDPEEEYTALYVMECAAKTKVEPKLCILFDEFKFNEAGQVVDRDGVVVKAVWKTWMWETAFKDYDAAKKERGANWKPKPSDKVRLCDLVLGDESIHVFEPLWKVVTSNKGLLPMISDSHSHVEFVLPASFTLTEELKKSGYAAKPIVGRVGQNVVLTEEDGKAVASTQGKFADRTVVYQKLVHLPEHDGYHAIVGGWVVAGEHGGYGIREDKSLVTNEESPFSALLVKM